MAEQELHSRDLVVQKMTRDGLIEENKTKGSKSHISNRRIEESYDNNTEDTNFKTRTGNVRDNAARSSKTGRVHPEKPKNNDKPELGRYKKPTYKRGEQKGIIKATFTGAVKKDAEEGREIYKFRKEDYKTWKEEPKEDGEKEKVKAGTEESHNKNVRLRTEKGRLKDKADASSDFSNIRPDVKKNAEKEYKYDAKNSYLKNNLERKIFESDYANTGLEGVHQGIRAARNVKRGIQAVKQAQNNPEYLIRGVKGESRRKLKQKAEQEVFEHKYDNLGLAALYHSYRIVETSSRGVRGKLRQKNLTKKQYQRQQPYLNSQGQDKSKNRLYKDKQTQDKQNEVKRAQKKQYKKKYAQAAREHKKTEQTMQTTAKNMKAAGKKLMELLATHEATFVGLCIAALFGMIILFFLVSAGANMLQIVFSEVLSGTYQTDYESMTNCESIFKNMEARLEERLQDIESEFPGYDEYRYQLDKIGHDPNLLLAYLGSKFQYFTPEQSKNELVEIFNLMYVLEFEEETEIRTRTVEKTDPITGETKEVEESYNYYILNITLAVNDLKEILEGRLNEDEKKQFIIYQETGGGQNIYPNPLDFDWHGSISSQFGYRIHPISGDLKFHSGVDIAAPAGSPIYSSMEGTVIKSGENGGYGLCVEIQNENGDRTRYAHCSKLLVAAGEKVKRRDKIAEVGSTGNSTGNHLHLEFISANGNYLNPLFIVSNFNR